MFLSTHGSLTSRMTSQQVPVDVTQSLQVKSKTGGDTLLLQLVQLVSARCCAAFSLRQCVKPRLSSVRMNSRTRDHDSRANELNCEPRSSANTYGSPQSNHKLGDCVDNNCLTDSKTSGLGRICHLAYDLLYYYYVALPKARPR